MRAAAVLLAAGESTRMGSPKPLLPWGGATLVERQTESLLEAGAAVVCVVTGPHGEEVASALSASPALTAAVLDGKKVVIVPNPRYREGKTTSIKAGLAALPPGAGPIIILAVDQPRPGAVTRCVLEAHAAAGKPISSPRYGGHGGHPLVFSDALLPELEAITEQREGLREVMRRHAAHINWVPFDDPVVRLDLNTPESYQAALRARPSS